MSVQPLDLTGGKSVYCFKQNQLDRAQSLAQEKSPSGERIRAVLATLQGGYSRNEQATVAFLLIHRLNTTPAEQPAATRANS